MSRLILICLAFSAACFGCMNLIDFAELAAGWQVTTDIDDLYYLAEHFLDDCYPDPIADNDSGTIYTNTLTGIDLEGQYCDQWQISGLPAAGILYDVYSPGHKPLPMTTTPRGSNWQQIQAVPYIIKKGGHDLYYYSESMTGDAFEFKTVNTDDGRISDAATVTITKAAYVKDSLCFDRSGSVTISDNAAIEFDDSFTFCFWIRPMSRFGTVLKKHGTGAGLEISIRSGSLVIEAWNSSGDYGKHEAGPLTLDQWQSFYITAGHATDNTPDLPDPPYSNDADLVIGDRFEGQIDKLTWFNALDDFPAAIFQGEARTVYGGLFSPTNYLAQFRCDEGTGSTITDFVSGTLTGSLTDVTWDRDDRPRRRQYNLF